MFPWFRGWLRKLRRRHLEIDGIAFHMKLHPILPSGEAQRAKIGFFAECGHWLSLLAFLPGVNAVREVLV